VPAVWAATPRLSTVHARRALGIRVLTLVGCTVQRYR
jgi:hypothetical protein